MSRAVNNRIYYSGGNHNVSYNSPEFMQELYQNIEERMQRPLTTSERRSAMNLVRSLNEDYLNRQSYGKVLQSLTKVVIEKIVAFQCDDEPVDTHEMLKRQIGSTGETGGVNYFGSSSRGFKSAAAEMEKKRKTQGPGSMVDVRTLFGFNNPYQIQKMLNPNALLRTNQIHLDTRYRILDNEGTNFFQWNHVNNLVRNQGTVNTVGIIRDIVALRCLPFKIPYSDSADRPYKKISLLIRELQAQSYVAHENKRYHFICDTNIDGQDIFLDPGNDGYYRFHQPVTQLDTITIEFASPLEPVEFTIDRSRGQTHTYALGVQTAVRTQQEHNLITGDLVYIDGFGSIDNLATPTSVALMNRSTGHQVIVQNGTDFKVNVDSQEFLPEVPLPVDALGNDIYPAADENILGRESSIPFGGTATPGAINLTRIGNITNQNTGQFGVQNLGLGTCVRVVKFGTNFRNDATLPAFNDPGFFNLAAVFAIKFWHEPTRTLHIHPPYDATNSNSRLSFAIPYDNDPAGPGGVPIPGALSPPTSPVDQVLLFRDYRPPFRPTPFAIQPIEALGMISVAPHPTDPTLGVVTGGQAFRESFVPGDQVSLVNSSINPAVDEGPLTVVKIVDDTEMYVERTLLSTINDLTALKHFNMEPNIYDIYFGSARIQIPIEITYLSPED